MEPLLALYRKALAGPWGEALRAEEPSLQSLVSRCRARRMPEDSLRAVDAEPRSVVSVNTPEGLARHGASLPSPGLRGNARD
ncbi:molybdopterin-guanine dinucleotide biosynthesis protein A [Cystobacter fuscus DSM 2262]|uniref:Molybdopterin-guanine dinucleotide biosynthesis protein A n=1 Tax=Cystobacter fuscus (strain ATCC 25194 / DSM 2262 / NBRC 100088 / M29) TaxID=1242864 RepID=S9PBD4_CYSF2|nr:molybdopterin-guanine dinucleotide biosynthesis protein A [Cystobacter fuscus DSM 2262]